MRRWEFPAAALIALAVLAMAALGASADARAGQNDARTKATAGLVEAVASIGDDVNAVTDDARIVAATVGRLGRYIAGLAAPSSAVAHRVNFASVKGSTYSIEGEEPISAQALQSQRGLLDLARDTAQPLVTPPLAVRQGAPQVFVVAPAFSSQLNGRPVTVATTADRRQQLLGYVFIGVSMTAVIQRAEGPGISIVIRSGPTVLGSSVGSGARTATQIDLHDPAWTVEASVARPATWSTARFGMLLAALAAGAACLLLGGLVRRRQTAADDRATAAEARLDLMMSLTPVVQQTTDLGRILPEVGARLQDELGLLGIGFAVPDSANRLRDVFTLGTVGVMVPELELPSALPAGVSVSLALHRGGRVAGLLRVRAGRGLSHDELDALRAAAEFTSAAIMSSQLFEQQEEAMRNLREVDALKTSFLTTASHELRTPVSAIMGFSTLLDEGSDTLSEDERRLFASRIRANAVSLDALVQDLLDFSRMERGRLMVALTSTNLASTIGSMLARLSIMFEEHQLVTQLDPTPKVLADPTALERVLANLVTNAVRYSPAGTTVTVRTGSGDGGAELIVDDEGPGVPESERSRIFTRFFRGAGEAVVRTRGTGIGLAVVREFVETMGGTVSVASSPAGGARFRIWLPAIDATEENAPT